MAIYDTDKLTEDEAILLYHLLARQFGWEGAFFTREDAESSWLERHGQTMPLTDEQWQKVCESWYWRKGLNELMTERGWELVHDAVQEVIDGEGTSA